MLCGGKHCKCCVAECVWQKKNGLWYLPLGDAQRLLAKFRQEEAHCIWFANGRLTSLITEFFILAGLTLCCGTRAFLREVAPLQFRSVGLCCCRAPAPEHLGFSSRSTRTLKLDAPAWLLCRVWDLSSHQEASLSPVHRKRGLNRWTAR